MRRNDEPVTSFGYDKVKALFAYLVIEAPFSFNRDVLAGLLWPDQTEGKARHSLRQAVAQLRVVLGEDRSNPFILADRTTVQRNPLAAFDCDVYRFSDTLKSVMDDKPADIAALEKVAGFYQGELLKGLSLAQTERFEEWLTNRREHFHRQAVTTLEKIASHYERFADYQKAMAAAEKWIRLEPWREEAHRKLIMALARTGQRTAALKQYQLCRRGLMEEFGLLPDNETERLHRRIVAMGSSRFELPEQPTPFIGRQDEMQRLSQLLADPEVRLLTITGPGGTGKTRLAIQIGLRLASTESLVYMNGVVLVPLDGVSSPEGIPAALAQALSFSFHKGSGPVDQLLHHLRGKEMLLILDNFEHLLGEESVQFIQAILEGARDIKILVTSRQKLSLRSEYILQLGGLKIPDLGRRHSNITIEDIHDYSATELFTSVLARVRGDSRLSEGEPAEIVRTCQLVEAMPLAVELAASLGGSHSLPEIAQAVQESLDFLQAYMHDLPVRHRSMHAAIDASWNLLNLEERMTFRKLGLFKGSFNFQAAQEISGAAKQTLSRLVNKSFLRYESRTGRYEIHELLRQYAEDKLAFNPSEKAEIRERHGQFYFRHALANYGKFFSRVELQALKEIEIELPNITTAWNWVIERQPANLAQLAAVLHHYFLRRSLFPEGIALFQTAIDRHGLWEKDANPSTLGWLHAFQGNLYAQAGNWNTGMDLLKTSLEASLQLNAEDEQPNRLRAFLLSRMGTFEQDEANSQAYLEESLGLYRLLGDKVQAAFVLAHLGNLLRTHGKIDRAQVALEESLAIHQELEMDLDKVRTLNVIGLFAMRKGELDNIESPLKEAVGIARMAGDQDQLATVLESLGIGFIYMGRFVQGEEVLQESMDIRVETGQRNSQLVCKYLLALAKLHQGNYQEAKSLAQQSIQIANELGDSSSTATSYLTLGAVALVKCDYDEARLHYENSISAFNTGWQQDWQSRKGIAYSLLGLVECLEGKMQLARRHFHQGLELIHVNKSYIGLMHAIPALGLYLVNSRRIDLAIEIYAMLESQPPIKNSAWFAEVAGQEIERSASSLNPERVLAARRAGRERELWSTARELLDWLTRDTHPAYPKINGGLHEKAEFTGAGRDPEVP